jgi:predicted nucleic acid-binding protein
MLIFIDSDILLDIILIRKPYNTYAMKLLSLTDSKQYEYCTSVHTLLNVHYVASKKYGKDASKDAIKLLIKKLTIIKDDKQIVEQALYSDFSDIGDAVQYFAAKSVNANAIITRNTKDFKLSTIPVLTADQFLNTL